MNVSILNQSVANTYGDCFRAITWAFLVIAIVLSGSPAHSQTAAVQEPLPPGAIARFGTTHLRALRGADLVFSPDGRYLAGGGSQEVYVWDVRTAKLLHHAIVADRAVRATFFSPDGKQLWCHSESTVQGWSVPNWTPLPDVALDRSAEPEPISVCRLRGHELVVIVKFREKSVHVHSTRGSEIVFERTVENRSGEPVLTPNQRHLVLRTSEANGRRWQFQVWDVKKHELRQTLHVKGSSYPEMTISPDSKRVIAQIETGAIHQWSLETGEELPAISTERGPRVTRGGLVPSPDAKLLACVGQDESITLFDIGLAKKLRVLDQRGTSAVFSPDGSMLAVHKSSVIDLVNVATGKSLFPQTTIDAQLISADGKTLVVGGDHGALEVLEVPSLKPRHRIFVPSTMSRSPIISPNGRHMGKALYAGAAMVWNLDKAGPAQEFPRGAERVASMAFSRGGDVRAISLYDGGIHVQLNRVAEEPLVRPRGGLYGHIGGVRRLVFSADLRWLASCGLDQTVRLWDLVEWKEVVQIRCPAATRPCLAFSPDSLRLAYVAGKQLYLVKVKDGTEEAHWDIEEEEASRLAFAPDGKSIALGASSGSIRLWNIERHKPAYDGVTQKTPVQALVFAPDGKRFYSGGNNGKIHIWEAATGKELGVLSGHSSPITALLVFADGNRLAAGDQQGAVRVWELETKRLEKELPNPARGPVVDQAVAEDGTRLDVLRGAPNSRSYFLKTGQTHEQYINLFEDYTGLAFSPDGKTFATATNGALRLWDLASQKNTRNLNGPLRCGTAVAFSPDGQRIAAGGQGLMLWNLDREKPVLEIPYRQTGQVLHVGFSPDGRWVAARSFTPKFPSILIYDAVTGQQVSSIEQGDPGQFAFSADGRLVIGFVGTLVGFSGKQRTLTVWEAATGRPFLELTHAPRGTSTFALLADDKTLFTGGWSRYALLWDFAAILETHEKAGGDKLPDDIMQLWELLGEKDPTTAFRAIRALTRRPEPTVALLDAKLQAVPKSDTPTAEAIDTLIKELAGLDPVKQREASRKLRRLGPLSRPALQKALDSAEDTAFLARLETLLATQLPALDPQTLRAIRSIQVLERLRSREARVVLERLAEGAPWARITIEASGALARSSQRKD